LPWLQPAAPLADSPRREALSRQTLEGLAHAFAGAGGMFGFSAVSSSVAKVE